MPSSTKANCGCDSAHTASTSQHQTTPSAQHSSGHALTESNLAAHDIQLQNRDSPLQRWYNSTDDTIFQGRPAHGWNRLVENDPLAAEIDAILREMGGKK
ncbi:hypothetical protein PRZ48_005931 [Zasmidium cellare]|uniref:Uncharacterized protein n=1 Tax=Zasmidium cellare TaxID=395010 RepID=A0ABR0EMX0_ZASCE|nr:hypothetical protein PRZ48_005931 [Zasmidium cellare]